MDMGRVTPEKPTARWVSGPLAWNLLLCCLVLH